MRFLYLFLFALLPALAQAQVPFNRSRDIVDLSSLPYTPAVLADWDGAADPGAADDAADQLADAVCDTVADKAAFTLADGGDGSLVAQAASNAVYTFQTTAAGSLQVNVTDVGGASGLTRYVVAEIFVTSVPANTWATTVVRQTVTFD